MMRAIVTVAPLGMPCEHAEAFAWPRSMFTKVMRSVMATVLLAPQSPTQSAASCGRESPPVRLATRAVNHMLPSAACASLYRALAVKRTAAIKSISVRRLHSDFERSHLGIMSYDTAVQRPAREGFPPPNSASPYTDPDGVKLRAAAWGATQSRTLLREARPLDQRKDRSA